MEPAGKLDGPSCMRLNNAIAAALTCTMAALFVVTPLQAIANQDWLSAVQSTISQGACSPGVIQRLTEAVGKSPDDPELHLTLGEAFQLNGFEELAREQFRLANRKDPRYLLNCFHARLSGTDRLNPQRIFFAARDLYANDAAVVYYDAFRQQLLGHQEEALKLMRRAVDRPNPWPGSIGMLSEMEAGLNLWKEAGKHAAQQLQLDPTNPQALSVHIRAEVRAGSPMKNLLPELMRANKLDRGDPYMSFLLARAEVASGNYTDAMEPALRGLVVPYGVSAGIKRTLVDQIYKHVPNDAFIKAVDDVASAIPSPAYRPYFRMEVAQILEDNDKHLEAHRQLQTSSLSGEVALSPELAIKLGNIAQGQHADYMLALNFYGQVNQGSARNPKAEAAKDVLMSRLVNYHNDLAWQLRNFLWDRSSTMPVLRRVGPADKTR
jgi:tetratricopeptide (TPR) repeat protein